MNINVTHFFQTLLYVLKFVKWDIVHENEPLLMKIMNDLALNELKNLSTLQAPNVTSCAITPWQTTITKD
jgi:hypothetical protein